MESTKDSQQPVCCGPYQSKSLGSGYGSVIESMESRVSSQSQDSRSLPVEGLGLGAQTALLGLGLCPFSPLLLMASSSTSSLSTFSPLFYLLELPSQPSPLLCPRKPLLLGILNSLPMGCNWCEPRAGVQVGPELGSQSPCPALYVRAEPCGSRDMRARCMPGTTWARC